MIKLTDLEGNPVYIVVSSIHAVHNGIDCTSVKVGDSWISVKEDATYVAKLVVYGPNAQIDKGI